jgi:tRNA-intron endonuclease
VFALTAVEGEADGETPADDGGAVRDADVEWISIGRLTP